MSIESIGSKPTFSAPEKLSAPSKSEAPKLEKTGDRLDLSGEAGEKAGAKGPDFSSWNLGDPEKNGRNEPTASQQVGQSLSGRNLKEQQATSASLLNKAQQGMLLNPDERSALQELAASPQINATGQLSLYEKGSENIGLGVKGFVKNSVGAVLSNDPAVRNGLYVANSAGVERKFELPNGTSVTGYAQDTFRTDRNNTSVDDPAGFSAGVKVEQKLPGGFSLGGDFSNKGFTAIGKLEGEVNGKKAGMEASLTSKGNSPARENARRALERDQRNRMESRQFGLPVSQLTRG